MNFLRRHVCFLGGIARFSFIEQAAMALHVPPAIAGLSRRHQMLLTVLIADCPATGHEHRTMSLSALAAGTCTDGLTSARHLTLLQPPCVLTRSRPFIRPFHRGFLSSSHTCRPCRPLAATFDAHPYHCRQHSGDRRGASHVLRAGSRDAYRQPDGEAAGAQREAKERAFSAWDSLVSRISAARLAATPQTSAFTNPKFLPMVLLCVPACQRCRFWFSADSCFWRRV